MALKKIDRIEKLICNYIIDHKLRLEDPDEDEYGQCVSSFELDDVLKDTNISVCKLTIDDMCSLCERFSNKCICKDNDEEEGEYYGCIHHIEPLFTRSVEIEIWDGYGF